jgi:hypothetical protein
VPGRPTSATNRRRSPTIRQRSCWRLSASLRYEAPRIASNIAKLPEVASTPSWCKLVIQKGVADNGKAEEHCLRVEQE